MVLTLAVLSLWLPAAAAEKEYELRGQVLPETSASISLFGATTPFNAYTTSDSRGRFRIRRLQPGSYTLSVFVAGQGEIRRTVVVGPSQADSGGRVQVTVELPPSAKRGDETLRRSGVVSRRQLSIPAQAKRAFREAQERLEVRDVAGAVSRLEEAVKLAPQFAEALNLLGTIAYQSKDYAGAEKRFREALAQDAEAYEPLVNLGGTLVSQGRFEEGLPYNLESVRRRPEDALANSQLGLNYYGLGRLEEAVKYLGAAKQLDPAHFSLPQLTLAEIYRQRNQPEAAAAELEDFLKHHPDWPEATKIRAAIARLRQ